MTNNDVGCFSCWIFGDLPSLLLVHEPILSSKDLKVLFILVIDAGVSATLAALTPRLKDFHQLLVDPPPVSHNLISCEFVFMVITHPGFLLGHSNQQTQG